MRPLLLLFLAFLLPTSSAELLENGDFSSSNQHWRLARAPGYGKGNTIDVKNKELRLGNMEASSPGYLNLTQAVDIQKGKSYRFTFEAKGTAGAKIGVSGGDNRARLVSGKFLYLETTDWEPLVFEFTAKVSTDASWFKEARKNGNKYSLGDGQTKEGAKSKGRAAIKNPEGIGACVIALGLGTYNGELALRNFSLIELP